MGCVEGVKEEPGRVQRRGSLRGTWGVKEGVCGIGDTGGVSAARGGEQQLQGAVSRRARILP